MIVKDVYNKVVDFHDYFCDICVTFFAKLFFLHCFVLEQMYFRCSETWIYIEYIFVTFGVRVDIGSGVGRCYR